MKKSTGVILVLIIVLLLGVIGVGGYFIVKGNNDTNNTIGELKNEIANLEKNIEDTSNIANTNSNSVANSNTSSKKEDTTNQSSNISIEQQVKSAYFNKLKNLYPNYSDIRIDDVRILTNSEKREIINTFSTSEYKETDILAVVEYSLKPQTIDGYVIAGNGEIKGDWVVGKTAAVCYRNGEIVSDGTGW